MTSRAISNDVGTTVKTLNTNSEIILKSNFSKGLRLIASLSKFILTSTEKTLLITSLSP